MRFGRRKEACYAECVALCVWETAEAQQKKWAQIRRHNKHKAEAKRKDAEAEERRAAHAKLKQKEDAETRRNELLAE